MPARAKKLTDADYIRLADFRYALRCFLEFSQKAAAAQGLTVQQHQALLVVRGTTGRIASIGRLAERLRIKHNSAVELAQRLEALGLVERYASEEDRRSVMILLTAAGAEKLEVLTHTHRRELAQLSPEIVSLFQSLESEE
jgi:DNA-binding MarR family transcriptional regulator